MKKGILKNFPKIRGKHLRQCLSFNKAAIFLSYLNAKKLVQNTIIALLKKLIFTGNERTLNCLFRHPPKSSLTLFCWDIHRFISLIWIQVHNLSFSAHLHGYFHFVYIEWNLQVGLLKPWWVLCTVMKFLHIIVILFLHLCDLTCKAKSHHEILHHIIQP